MKLDGSHHSRKFVCERVEGQLGDALWGLETCWQHMAAGLGREERCLVQRADGTDSRGHANDHDQFTAPYSPAPEGLMQCTHGR